MAYFRGVVLHLPRVKMHNIKCFYVGFYHAKGFSDWCMYKENNYGLGSHTWDEYPCRIMVWFASGESADAVFVY